MPGSSKYRSLLQELSRKPATWLVTGVGGFIGSNLAESLLGAGQKVVGLDNFSTGKESNLDEVRDRLGADSWARFTLIRGDIRELEVCRKACTGVTYVLHQAAIGSVPRSIEDPIFTHQNNVDGFVNILVAARDANVKRFVYASSSSVYGDSPVLPKKEDVIGKPLSPYALTKGMNEQYARVFSDVYGMECIGLRYFNVFGPKQDPNGPYAAVIPSFFKRMIRNEKCAIFGTGENSRDFCFVENVIQANLLAATVSAPEALNQVYNVGVNGRTTVSGLFQMILERMKPHYPHLGQFKAVYEERRKGDIPHSQADISKAERLLGYAPEFDLTQGLDRSVDWYRTHF